MASRATPPPLAQPVSGRPSRGTLLRWVGVVLTLHLVVLLGMAGAIDWQIKSSPMQPSGPWQTRTIPAADTTITDQRGRQPAKPAIANAHTRIAIEHVEPRPVPATQNQAAKRPSVTPSHKAATPPGTLTGTADRMPDPEPANGPLPENTTPKALESGPPVVADTNAPSPPAKGADNVVLAELLPSADKTPQRDGQLPATSVRPPDAEATTNATLSPVASPASSASVADAALVSATPPEANTAPTRNTTPAPAAPLARATLELPNLPLGAIPPSVLLSYHLQGQEKGVNYSASGELRWQHNASAYALSLSVKALLLGSRHWRSLGLVTPEGLAPVKYSDSWRSERVAHFDRPQQRIVFSSNAPTVPLQAGAQDQVSLYVQLAAAMAQQSTPLPIGTRLQIQTVTVRDALPWLLTLEKTETLQLNGSPLQTTLWICQPRNRFDARVEFWVAAEHDWLPARIRITQTTGNFIDLQLSGRSSLPDLPPAQRPG